MALQEWTVIDFMRGGEREITIRFDKDNLVKLPCHCEYDPVLCSKEGNFVAVVRKVEAKNKDDTWSPYPSVSWLDSVENDEQLQTRVLIKKTNEDGITIAGSTDGVPDGKLMCAAKDAGIYTETIDG